MGELTANDYGEFLLDVKARCKCLINHTSFDRNANLGNANLGNANLRNANLGNANLRNANLGNANLPIGILPNNDLIGILPNSDRIGIHVKSVESPGERNADTEIGVPKGGEENADTEIGVPNGVPVFSSPWHSRGYLPHFDVEEAVQHVTFHLADSLPKETLSRMHMEIEHLPEDQRKHELTLRLQDWMDAGHGSCILHESGIAAMMQNVLLFFDNIRYKLFEWVVMPNHVHVLFKPLQGWKVSQIVSSWKKFSARKITEWNANRNANRNANLPIGILLTNDRIGILPNNNHIGIHATATRSSAIWHREYWDRFMRDAAHFHRTSEYIRYNPVKAGLVESQEQWRWGSAFGNAGGEKVEEENAGQETGVPKRGEYNAGREAGVPKGVPELKKSLLHQAFEGEL
ncbi:MAG: transposase [Deltaproteobacteria bacterium]|nr:transposase [Deltaproteobacteria bacterium]